MGRNPKGTDWRRDMPLEEADQPTVVGGPCEIVFHPPADRRMREHRESLATKAIAPYGPSPLRFAFPAFLAAEVQRAMIEPNDTGVRYQVEDHRATLRTGYASLAEAEGYARHLKRTSHRLSEVKVYEYACGDPQSYRCVRRF